MSANFGGSRDRQEGFMITLRKTFIAAMATAIVTVSAVASFDSAKAGPREGMRNHGQMFRGGHRSHGRRHGGFGNVGTGLAIGLGVAVISNVIAAAQDSDERIHADAERDGWTAVNQRRHDCHVLREYRKLVKAAKEALQRDIRMNRENPEFHSFEHVNFSRKELRRRQNELRRARERCA
jgi:hypothetical protein